MRYPCKIKQLDNKYISHSNRGMSLESDINITNDQLVVNYITDDDFNFTILKNWPKAITIPYKVSKYLNKNFEFLINKKAVDISNFIN